MKHFLRLAGWMLFGCLFVSIAAAQPSDSCPVVLQSVLDTIGETCETLGRNQVCYGNNTILPSFRAEADSVVFESAGDLADLADLVSLQLNAMSEDGEEWGVAMLSAQASLPDTLPGQNVTFLLFGDVEISADAPGSEVDALESQGLETLQAFYFRTGIGDRACVDAPDSGILVQTPEGAGSITLTTNGVEISLGSTLYIQAEPEGDMTLSVIEGSADVTADGETVTAAAGTFVTVPLTEDLAPAGPPSEPEPYDAEALGTLPISVLPREITIAEPLSGDSVDSGEAMQLQVGTWTAQYLFDDPRFNNCGNELVGTFPMEPFELTSPDINDIMVTTGEAMVANGGTYEITNPEPNHYVMTVIIQDLDFIFEYRILSPTEMESISSTPSVVSECRIVVPTLAEHSGDE